MRTYQGYEKVTIGDIPQKKLEKAIKTGKLTLSASDLKGDRVMLVHPANAKLIKAAKAKSRGITGMGLTAPEILSDMEWHNSMGGSMNGGSVWSWLKSAAKSAGKFFKNNWDTIKPIATQVVDGLMPSAASSAGPYAPGVILGRQALKSLTGVGIKEQRLLNLAKARAAKASKKSGGSTGGSFLIN